MPSAPTTAETSDTPQKKYSNPTSSGSSGAGAGSSPTITATGKDSGGSVTVVTGSSGSGVGALATVTFPAALSIVPQVMLTPTNAAAATLQVYVSAVTKTGFTIATGNAPANSTTYSWSFAAALG